MRTELFDYHLPEELIAKRPTEERDGARMCVVGPEGLRHGRVAQFVEELSEGDLLVLNETRVRRARLYCHRPTLGDGQGGGGRVELLFLRPLRDGLWEALGKSNRPLCPSDELVGPEVRLTVVERDSAGILSVKVDGDLEGALLRAGSMPIPPYLSRPADSDDVERYQTVFARELGSAAAPTAGLHLTQDALRRASLRGVRLGRLVLHVGVGTFRPVSAEDLDDHPMHAEEMSVDESLVEAVQETRTRGGRVVAVGTTAVRALESAADDEREGMIVPRRGSTRLLIQPGYRFRVVDALLTNFHQPRSTLLALVSAFVGTEVVRSAYREAVAQRYRFLSYGDAMWIPRRLQTSEAEYIAECKA